MDICLREVSFQYGGDSEEGTQVLSRYSIEIPSGQILALLGPSGCGKSTLLKLLLGMIRPESGEVLLGGKAPGAGQRISAMLSESRLFPWLTLEQNLRLAGSPERVEEYLSLLQMEQWKSYFPSALSVGMTQKIQLARMALLPADIWLLDEPFNGLDIQSKELVFDFLNRLKGDKTVILVTHHVQEAMRFAERILLWNQQKHRPDREWMQPCSAQDILAHLLDSAQEAGGLVR